MHRVRVSCSAQVGTGGAPSNLAAGDGRGWTGQPRCLRELLSPNSHTCPPPRLLPSWVVAGWARDTDTRQSHTGFVLMFNGGPISWKSRRQDSVALSTSEAVYITVKEARRSWTSVLSFRISVSINRVVPISMKTTVLLSCKNVCFE